jgi:hypothetical protein
MAVKKYKSKPGVKQVKESPAKYGDNDVVFSKHALEQMELRGIFKTEVIAVIKNPQQVKKENGKKVFQSVIENGNYLMRIFVNDKVVPAIIITVYKTSKIQKYHEGKI